MSKKTVEYVAYSGEIFTIEWYYNKNHKSDAFEYYQLLDEDERDAIISLFKLMGNNGKILNPTKFKSEGDKIYAFKTDQERFLSFFCHGKKIIVTNGFRKKTQKMTLREKEKAIKRQADYLQRERRGEYYDE